MNGQYDPDRRSWSHDWWNRTRTNRQRQNVNYDGFEVDGEGNARPHYTRYEKFSSRWGRRQRRFRNWFRRTGQQEPWNWEGYGDRSADYDQTPPRRWVPSWRSDRPTPMPTPGLVSNAEQLPTRGPELSSGTQSLGVSAASNPTTRGKGSEMSDNGSNGGSAPNTVAGRLEAMAYEAGSANAHRSAVWHVAVANQLRAWAARLSNSDNPYHRASASTYALMAARANEVALNDARLAAVQKGQAQRAIGSGQQATD